MPKRELNDAFVHNQQSQKRRARSTFKTNIDTERCDINEPHDEPSNKLYVQPHPPLTIHSPPPARRIDHTYYDYANHHINDNDGPRSKRSLCTFPAKLHAILSNPQYSHILTWQPHGRAWKIIDSVLLMKEVIPAHWSQTKYESFTRQLNGWGFKRLYQSGPDFHCYYHECFLRGLPQIVQLMRRIDSNLGKQLPDVECEPNFYDIQRRHPLPNLLPSPSMHQSHFPPWTHESPTLSLPPYPFYAATHLSVEDCSSHSIMHDTPIERRTFALEHNPSHGYGFAAADHSPSYHRSHYNQHYNSPSAHAVLHNQHQYHSFPALQPDYYQENSQVLPSPSPLNTYASHQIPSPHFVPNQFPRYAANSITDNYRRSIEGQKTPHEAGHPYCCFVTDGAAHAALPPTSPQINSKY